MQFNMLNAHIERVGHEDPFFRTFWGGASDDRQLEYRRTWERIETAIGFGGERLQQAHLRSFDLSKRFFVRVQEREFLYDRVPDDWAAFARNLAAKQALYAEGLIRLEALVELLGMSNVALVYGNIKEDRSLDMKLNREGTGSAIQTNVIDLWDIVRFRIVVPDLNSLLLLSVRFWEKFFDQVLRCRNYYFRPRNGHAGDPYRAVHFELANNRNHMIEVQLMTKLREAVALLDHAALFKGTLQSFTANDERWLREFSMKANILDADDYLGPNTE
jgi:hypothetical protein